MARVTRKPGQGAAILKAAIASLENVTGKVGWFESSKYPDGTSVAYVAAIQEMGFAPKGIPPRMGMRQMAKVKREAWARVAETGAKRIMKGNATAPEMMELIGAVAEADLRKQIKSVTEPPLAESTLAARAAKLAKGDSLTATGSSPLNDTGLMIATATHIVGTGGNDE